MKFTPIETFGSLRFALDMYLCFRTILGNSRGKYFSIV